MPYLGFALSTYLYLSPLKVLIFLFNALSETDKNFYNLDYKYTFSINRQ